MSNIYSFDSVESLKKYLNSDKCEEGDIVSFKTEDNYRFIITIGINILSPIRKSKPEYHTDVLQKSILVKQDEIKKLYRKISEDMKEEPFVSLIIRPDVSPKLLVPVEPVEKPFPDIEVENRRWFEDFGREMRGRKQKYINKTNPKKGSANYETQRIRNTEQIVHRQHRCQER